MNDFNKEYDLIVVGAGPGGLAAAVSAKRCGVSRILILERRDYGGGILPQCVHDGFGLYLYGQSLTGPEYAAKWMAQLKELNIHLETGAMALKILPSHEEAFHEEENRGQRESTERTDSSKKKKWSVSYLCRREGLCQASAYGVVIATGCREKTLAQLHIPGSRPAGIYTAGSAQYMMNIQNYLPGKTAVILGSGDIGLIMARRMILEGIHVKLILGQKSTGLVRNIVQCVEDFQIPMRYGWSVVSVHGYKRVKGVTIAPVHEDGQMDLLKKEYVPCDTLLVAAGLLPELELCRDSGFLEEDAASLTVDEGLSVGVPGIFACGNAVKIHDLADSVSYEGQKCGVGAANYILRQAWVPEDLKAQLDIKICEPKGSVTDKGEGAFQKGDKDSKDRKVICILCPLGCQITVKNDAFKHGTIDLACITGQGCEKGRDYAFSECKDPKRTVTTSVKVEGSLFPLLPVRTHIPISKSDIPAVMAAVKKYRCKAPVAIGEILIKNVGGTHGNLIASAGALVTHSAFPQEASWEETLMEGESMEKGEAYDF
ncbi:MAG: DUF1667 domain-containing protein [Anaerovorax sp.]